MSYRAFDSEQPTVCLKNPWYEKQQQMKPKRERPEVEPTKRPEEYPRREEDEKEDEEERERQRISREAYGKGYAGLEQSVGPGEPLPANLQAPYNVGVMCRVRDGDLMPKPSRTFSEVYAKLSQDHRVWLKPVWWIRKYFPAINAYADPLHTAADKPKPWVWEGGIPFIIRAVSNPEAAGLSGRKPLGIAFPIGGDGVNQTWQITKNLVELAFDREANKGGFYYGAEIAENWIKYKDAIVQDISMSIKEAGNMLGIDIARASQANIKDIETYYNMLYEANDPAKVDAETNSELFDARTKYFRHLQAAYFRILLERLLRGKPIASTTAGKNRLLESVLSMVVELDKSRLNQGYVRLVWKKKAPALYHLKSSTLKYGYDEQGELSPVHVGKVLVKWVHELIDPYMKTGNYDLKVDVEGLPEVF